MVIIGKFSATVQNAEYREFSAKEKPDKVYKLNEIEFTSKELGIGGVVRDWDLSYPVEKLLRGTEIIVIYNACKPVKGFSTFFEFSGFVEIVKK